MFVLGLPLFLFRDPTFSPQEKEKRSGNNKGRIMEGNTANIGPVYDIRNTESNKNGRQ
jgi:hypothetical protein